MNPVDKIIQQANDPIRFRLNILTVPSHERYETQLCKTGHNFFAIDFTEGKKWETKSAPLPKNYYILPTDQLTTHIDYDIILIHDKKMYELGENLIKKIKAPLIILEHQQPMSDLFGEQYVSDYRNKVGDVNVFVTDVGQKSWGIKNNSLVINHSIDYKLFNDRRSERKNSVLSVVNDFAQRDYALNFKGWQRVTDGLDVELIGYNDGLSEQASSVTDLVETYNSHSIFFNSSTRSSMPMTILEAMSCGCAVVSTATCAIPELITHGVDGYISNDESELRGYIEKLLSNPEEARKMGAKARASVQEKFSEKDFITKWNRVFNACVGRI